MIRTFILAILLVMIQGCAQVRLDNGAAESKKYRKSVSAVKADEKQLLVVGVSPGSAADEGGIEKGDIFVSYNGIPVRNTTDLADARSETGKNTAYLIMLRDGGIFNTSIASKQLGVEISEKEPEIKIRKDAILLDEDIKLGDKGLKPGAVLKLSRNGGMSNSFIASVRRVLQYGGTDVDYTWLCGISSAAFRFQFHRDWCPSSSDPAVGYSLVDLLFDAVGCNFSLLFDTNEQNNYDTMVSAIIESIENDKPAVAIELSDTSEWGVITGIQRNGKEILCRTSSGKRSGYSIAEKFPWQILFLENCNEKPEKLESVWISLDSARRMAEMTMSGYYYLGSAGLRYWIERLESDDFDLMSDEALTSIIMTNAWLYNRLCDDRMHAWRYLRRIAPIMPWQTDKIEELSMLYKEEVTVLNQSLDHVPFPWMLQDLSLWTSRDRESQIASLEKAYRLELRARDIFASLTGSEPVPGSGLAQ